MARRQRNSNEADKNGHKRDQRAMCLEYINANKKGITFESIIWIMELCRGHNTINNTQTSVYLANDQPLMTTVKKKWSVKNCFHLAIKQSIQQQTEKEEQ